MNFKRRRSKRVVKCTLCTNFRWMGNSRKAWHISKLRYYESVAE